MIIYNTTVKVELQFVHQFVAFITKEHLVHSMATGFVSDNAFYKLLNIDNSDGVTYCIQYKMTDIGMYNQYCMVFDNQFKEELKNKFGENLVYFSSILQEVTN